MKRYLPALLIGIYFACAALCGAAPGLLPGQAGLPPILAKIFGESAAFSAKAQVRLTGKTPAESMQVPMDFFFSRGNMRAEINMAEVKSDALPEEMVLSLKQIGMDRMVTILRPGNHPAWVLYPHLKASLEIPPPNEPTPDRPGKESVRETKLGQETVSGQSCDKCRFVYRDGLSRAHEAVVWRSRDAKRFPLQIQMTHADTILVVNYTNVQHGDLSPDKFTLPPGYKKYDTMETIMREALKNLFGGAKP
jgi:hypothetical protein